MRIQGVISRWLRWNPTVMKVHWYISDYSIASELIQNWLMVGRAQVGPSDGYNERDFAKWSIDIWNHESGRAKTDIRPLTKGDKQ